MSGDIRMKYHAGKSAMARLSVMLFFAFIHGGCSKGPEPSLECEEIGGITMVTIPAGSFRMGYDFISGDDDDGVARYYPDEQPVHTVTLRSFQIGSTEITREQYLSVMENDPSSFEGESDLPVTNVGATRALEFCNRMSELSGLEPCYDPATGKCDFDKNGFRLPTEAEWEYSCRGGTTTHFNSGNERADLERAGWFLDNSGGHPHSVGGKEPNAWGLYDMHGNVWESCYDGYDETFAFGNYPESPVADPTGHDNFNLRIIRGGGWYSEASECRSAVRGAFWTGGGSSWLGFRVARSIR